jgi:hypothetical protein
MLTINRNPEARDLRQFGWAMLLGFGAIGLLLWLVPWLRAGDPSVLAWTGCGGQIGAICCWGVGAILGGWALAAPATAKPAYILWMSLTVPLGVAVSTVVLTLLFLFLLPIFSLIARMGDPLRKNRNNGDTYWEDYRPHEPTLERMARLF